MNLPLARDAPAAFREAPAVVAFDLDEAMSGTAIATVARITKRPIPEAMSPMRTRRSPSLAFNPSRRSMDRRVASDGKIRWVIPRVRMKRAFAHSKNENLAGPTDGRQITFFQGALGSIRTAATLSFSPSVSHCLCSCFRCVRLFFLPSQASRLPLPLLWH